MSNFRLVPAPAAISAKLRHSAPVDLVSPVSNVFPSPLEPGQFFFLILENFCFCGAYIAPALTPSKSTAIQSLYDRMTSQEGENYRLKEYVF